MTVAIKMTGRLYNEVRLDLERPRPFAHERVGFIFGRIGTGDADGKLLLLTRYHAIPDKQYINDPTVGARIGPDAMTWAMQAVYHGRAAREGIFHIHLHGYPGETGMSKTDRDEIPPMMPGFQSVGHDAAHGIIILSLDHGSAWACLPGDATLVPCGNIAVIGAPVHVFDRSRTS
jgi:hypothetical protein